MVVPTRSASLLLPEVQKRLEEEQLPYASNTSQIRRRLNHFGKVDLCLLRMLRFMLTMSQP